METRGGTRPVDPVAREDAEDREVRDDVEPVRADYAPEGTDARTGLWPTLKRTALEFQEDNMTDWAAALTYYGLLSLFPALIALVSVLGLFGDPQTTTKQITDIVTQIGPSSAADTFSGPIESITSNRSAAGILFFVGLATALWSASGYIGAFMRASNIAWETPEGRSFFKLRPLQLLVTLVMVILLAVVALALVMTGPVVQAVGDSIGVGSTALQIWDIAKWPVLLGVVILIFSLLYYASPNVKLPGFRFITPGAIFAVFRLAPRLGPVRLLRRELRLLRQDLRDARRHRHPARLDVDLEPRAAVRHGAQRRARAQSRARCRRPARRARDPTRAPRRTQRPTDHLTQSVS